MVWFQIFLQFLVCHIGIGMYVVIFFVRHTAIGIRRFVRLPSLSFFLRYTHELPRNKLWSRIQTVVTIWSPHDFLPLTIHVGSQVIYSCLFSLVPTHTDGLAVLRHALDLRLLVCINCVWRVTYAMILDLEHRDPHGHGIPTWMDTTNSPRNEQKERQQHRHRHGDDGRRRATHTCRRRRRCRWKPMCTGASTTSP